MSISRRTAFFSLILGLGFQGAAQAGFLVTFAGQSAGAFNYTLDFSNSTNAAGQLLERIDPSSAKPGVPGMATIFGFNNGGTSMPVVTLTGTAAASFTVTESLVPPIYSGTTPVTAVGSPLYSITFNYIGAPTSMATSWAGISIATNLTGQTITTTTGQDSRNGGLTDGTPVITTSSVIVPSAVPEPASVALLGLGGVAALFLRRRSAASIA